MTSENELDVIKTIENKEEEPSELITPVEQITIPKVEEEPINTGKPKRAGRKKREVDIKTENFNNDTAMDTQPLFEQPIILEGKRSRKPTSRLELSELTPPKKELSIPQGRGKLLGEIEYINYQITHASTDALSHMRNICFGRRAAKANIRKNLREFNGFEFERNSEEYERHLSNLTKLKKDQLRSLSDILGLPATGRNDEHAERILSFLLEPIDDGKQIPESKMSMRTSTKSSTNSKESIHTDEEENEIEEKTENGDDNDDDDDEIFNEEEEDDDEEVETEDEYIGSDEESGLNTKDDDPDDFVYKPGKKIPKKRPSMKRLRSKTTPKRKRGAATKSKRGRKRSKVTVSKKTENEDITVPIESMQTNAEEIDKTNEDNSITEPTTVEPKNDELNKTDTNISDTTTNNTVTDIIPTTS